MCLCGFDPTKVYQNKHTHKHGLGIGFLFGAPIPNGKPPGRQSRLWDAHEALLNSAVSLPVGPWTKPNNGFISQISGHLLTNDFAFPKDLDI